MARTPKNHREPWKANDDALLRRLAKGNTPTGLIANQLGRSEAAVRTHAQRSTSA